jgi:predicted TIM-barrel enzyme
VALGAVGLLVAAGGLVLVGGGSDPSYREEATAVCDESFESIGAAQSALLPAGTGAGPDAQAEFVAGAYVDLLRERLIELRALDAPAEEGASYRELLDAYEAVVDHIEADPVAVVEAGAEGVDPFAEVDAALDEFGLVACGSRRPA